MSEKIERFIKTDYRANAFDHMRRGKRVPAAILLKLLLHGLFVEPFLFLIRFFPGAVGIQLRVWLGKLTLGSLGRCSFIEFGAILEGARNIRISDYVLIDRHVELDARGGEITIGRRVHIGPGAQIAGLGGVFIADYAAIGRNAQILSHSEAAEGGKRMSGPMIPEEIKAMKTAAVRLEKDSFVGVGAVILPGITLGEGAVVAANSLVIADVKPWQIVMGVPARPVGQREPVSVPDI
jgi:acetyltransferase-like isoleucine patch superfamily enzyme